MRANHLIEAALDKVRSTAGVKTVYGEPIKVDGKTIIPIAKVAFGAKPGAGPKPKDFKAETVGEGGRIGAYAVPVGVVEVSDDATKFVPINAKKQLSIAGAVGAAIGMVLGLVLGRRGRST